MIARSLTIENKMPTTENRPDTGPIVNESELSEAINSLGGAQVDSMSFIDEVVSDDSAYVSMPPVNNANNDQDLRQIFRTNANMDWQQLANQYNGSAPEAPLAQEECVSCSDMHDVVDMRSVRTGGFVCQNCYDDEYYTCDQCGEALHADDMNVHEGEGDDVCRFCETANDRNLRTRREDRHSTAFQSVAKGKVIQSLRRFGVEIELYVTNRDKGVKLCNQLPKEFGIGNDSSIHPDDREGTGEAIGLEVKTPILQGAKGEKAIKDATRTIRKYALCNSSCGLHVHLEAVPIDWRDVKKIFMFYVMFDEVIMAMLPTGRRNCQHAKSLKSGYSLEKIMAIDHPNELAKSWYQTDRNDDVEVRKGEHYQQTRYYGINFHSLLCHEGKTIEIRYHSPTFSPTKILNWVALHQHVIDTVPTINERTLKGHASLLFFEDKLNVMCELLQLSPVLEKYVRDRIALFNPKHKKVCAG